MQESFHNDLMVTQSLFAKNLFAMIKESNLELTAGQPKVLEALLNSNGDLMQHEIAHLCAIESPTLTRILTGMAKDGLIERKRPADNQRVVLVNLTSYGRECAEKLMLVFAAAEKKALVGVSSSELEVMVKVLRILQKNLMGEKI